MLAYVRQRIFMLVPTVLGVTTVVFLLLHLMPGDPVEVMLGETAGAADRAQLRSHLGLDRALPLQYVSFLAGVARGNLGHSIYSGRPVATIVAERIPATLGLALTACCVAIMTAVPAGLLSAARPRSRLDRVTLGLSLVGVAIPNFWLGPLLILCFAVWLDWLPVSGTGGVANVILPAITLGLGMAGVVTRMTRTAVLETLHQDFIRTARAKGVSATKVLTKHALSNALSPLLTIIGLQFGSLLAGSVITETIFAWPGLGRLTLQAIQTRDYPVVQGCVLTIAVGYVLVNLATDLAYAWANPRLRSHGAI